MSRAAQVGRRAKSIGEFNFYNGTRARSSSRLKALARRRLVMGRLSSSSSSLGSLRKQSMAIGARFTIVIAIALARARVCVSLLHWPQVYVAHIALRNFRAPDNDSAACSNAAASQP